MAAHTHPLAVKAQMLIGQRLSAVESLEIIREIRRATSDGVITFRALNITKSDFELMEGKIEHILYQAGIRVEPILSPS